MCGVVGAFLLKAPFKVDPGVRRALSYWIHNEVLYHTVERGKDSTGFAVSFDPPAGSDEKPFWFCVKQPVKTEEFFLNNGEGYKYKGQQPHENIDALSRAILKVPGEMRFLLGHTRKKTLGTHLNPHNNHPIVVGNIVGIHNGGVRNHDTIFEHYKEKWTRVGEVDSEAIIQLLAENANDRALDWEDINFVNERILGARAVMAFNSIAPENVVFFRNSERPLDITYIPELGLLILNSERKFLNAALDSYNRIRLISQDDLPVLTTDTAFLSPGEGGVVRMNREFDPKDNLKTFLGIKDHKKVVLFDFDPEAQAAAKRRAREEEERAKRDREDAERRARNSQAYGTTALTPTPRKTIGFTPPAYTDVIDVSEYGDENTTALNEVNAEVVVDDTSNETTTPRTRADTVPVGQTQEDIDEENLEEEEVEEVDDTLLFDEYGVDVLRKEALEICISEAHKNDPEMLFERMDSHRKLITTPNISDDEAEEIIHSLYPETFSDGFIYGARWAYDRHLDTQDAIDEEMENLAEENEKKGRQVEALLEDLEKSKTARTAAAKLVASLKGMLCAAFVYGDMVDFDDEGNFSLTEEFSQYLQMSSPYKKVKTERILDLLNQRDLEIMERALTELNSDHEKKVNK